MAYKCSTDINTLFKGLPNVEAAKIIGLPIRNISGEEIGTITDVKDGKIICSINSDDVTCSKESKSISFSIEDGEAL